MGNFKEDIVKTEAFIFDVDGVMTDGGNHAPGRWGFHPKILCQGRLCHRLCAPYGLQVCIITGGRGATLDHRLKMLGITDVYLDCMDKISAMQDFFARHGLDPANVIYMGDDIPDLECMKAVGIPVCPSDAASEVIEASRYVSEFAGGHGCVRDIIEQVLRARDDWARDSRGMHSSNIAASR